MTAQATIIGNLTHDPELRISQAGKPWTNIRMVSTVREKDRQSGEWKDSDPLYVSIPLFGDMADHAVQSLSKGTRIIATGVLKNRSYQDNQGNERVQTELVECQGIGPDLRWATAQVTRAQRGGSGASSTPDASPWSSGTANGPQNGFQDDPGFGSDDPFGQPF